MHISEDVTSTLRANARHHEPVVLIYDSRGNGGGIIAPTITGDHQNRITDYTAIVVKDEQTDYKWVQQEQVEQGKLIIYEDI